MVTQMNTIVFGILETQADADEVVSNHWWKEGDGGIDNHCE